MEWWVWALIGVGVVVIGAIKLAVFKRMKQKKGVKQTFED